MQVELTRQELYELVWSKPILHVAKDLGISDRGLARTCIRHDIPTPGIGYWRRVECGHDVERIELPPPDKRKSQTIYLNGQQSQKEGALKHSTFLEDVIRYESKPANAIKVPQTVKTHHPLVSKALIALNNKTWPDQCGRPILSGGHLDWRVSPTAVPRSARIWTSLLNALEKRGHSITFQKGETGACINGQVIHFQLWEHMKRFDHPDYTPDSYSSPPKWFFQPTGTLLLRITGYYREGLPKREWKDKPDQPIEAQLNAFIIALAQGSVLLEAEEQERKRQQEEEDRERREAYRAECFENDLLRWNKAYHLKGDLENFIKFMKESDTPLPYEDIPKEKWLVWARAYAHESFKEAFYSSFDKESSHFR